MLRPRIRIPRVGRLWRPEVSPAVPPALPSALSYRQLHNVPFLKRFEPEMGIPGLLSPGGFDMAWTQYMELIVERLNTLVAGTDFEHQDTLTIVKATAREPSQAPIFNYASMAHNNALFFEGIANLTEEELAQSEAEGGVNPGEDRMSARLKHELTKQFSSVETLRREFLVTAMGMFGPGFVWLIKNAQTTDLRILVTYLAGTPYTAGHWRRQGLDMNTHGVGDTGKEWLQRTQAGAGADVGSRFMPHNQTAPGGTDVIPLLCLNTWEHVWLRDYGIGAGGQGGKRQFIQAWWNCIDWNQVEGRAALDRPGFKGNP